MEEAAPARGAGSASCAPCALTMLHTHPGPQDWPGLGLAGSYSAFGPWVTSQGSFPEPHSPTASRLGGSPSAAPPPGLLPAGTCSWGVQLAGQREPRVLQQLAPRDSARNAESAQPQTVLWDWGGGQEWEPPTPPFGRSGHHGLPVASGDGDPCSKSS